MVHFNSSFLGKADQPRSVQGKIEQALNAAKPGDDLDALLAQVMASHNSTPDPEIGGFTPETLFALQRSEWGDPHCPLKFSEDLSLDPLNASVRFQGIRKFLLTIHEMKTVKATARGNLPRKFVKGMLDTFLDESQKELLLSVCKVVNEPDLFPLHEARILCEISGLIGQRKGAFSLRKKAKALLKEEAAGSLYRLLFITYFREYNMMYGRRGLELEWLQNEIGYALKPLQLWANKWYDMEQADTQLLHPMALARLQDEIKAVPYMDARKVLAEYFVMPLEEWGLLSVEKDKENGFEIIKRIKKTELFDLFIHFD